MLQLQDHCHVLWYSLGLERKKTCSLICTGKQQITFHVRHFVLVSVSMVLSKPRSRSAEGTLCLTTILHRSWVCAGQSGPHEEEGKGLTATPGRDSVRLEALDSGGVRVIFVFLLPITIHELNGAGFVPLDEIQDIGYSRLGKKSVLKSGCLFLNQRLTSWS